MTNHSTRVHGKVSKAYGEETGKKVEYIKPTEKSDNAYKEAIDQAVNKYKAKVIVTPGYLFEPSIYESRIHIRMLNSF